MNPTRRNAAILGMCLVLGLWSPMVAGQAQAPPRAGAAGEAQEPPTSALVLGQVVDGDTGQPVADAVVSVTVTGGAAPESAMPGMAGASGAKRVLTTAEGRFVVRDLPAGVVNMTVVAAGYINGSYGQTRPGGAPEPLRIRAGESALTARIRIWRSSSISGIVRDGQGEPLPGQQVRALFRSYQHGQPRVSVRATAVSDDRGVYYLSALQPGDYLVSVAQTMVSMPVAMLDTMMTSVMGGDMSGAMALADVAMSGGAIAANGTRIDDMVVGTPTGGVPRVGEDGRLLVLAGRFAPSAETSADATMITLGTGQARTGVDVTLPYERTVSVSGRVVGPTGPVADLPVRLQFAREDLVADSSVDVASATTRKDGTFTMPAVPRGAYVLRAMRAARPGVSAAQLAQVPAEMREMMQKMLGAPGEDPRTLYADLPITVSSDVKDVALTLSAGATIAGSFEFLGTGKPPALTGVRVSLTALDGRWSSQGVLPMAMAAAATEVNATELTFKTAGQPPGRYAVTLTPANLTGWFVRSIVVNGQDVTYSPLELGNRDLTGMVITYTDKSASIGGQVQMGETRGSGATVVLFPRAWREWIAGGMHPSLSRSLRTIETGAFALNGLPPNEYLIAAVPNEDAPNLQDPTVFEALERIALPVRVMEGESQRVSPRLQVWR